MTKYSIKSTKIKPEKYKTKSRKSKSVKKKYHAKSKSKSVKYKSKPRKSKSIQKKSKSKSRIYKITKKSKIKSTRIQKGGNPIRRHTMVQVNTYGSKIPQYNLLDKNKTVKILETSALQCINNIEEKWSSILNIKKEKLPFQDSLLFYTVEFLPNKFMRLLKFLKNKKEHEDI